MTKRYERTNAFKYCARLIGEVLTARSGEVVSPEKLKAAMWRQAELEDKTDHMKAGISYVAQALAESPPESLFYTGGLITRVQEGWKKKIEGYLLVEPKGEDPGPGEKLSTPGLENLDRRIRDLEANDRRREVELAELKRKIWGRQAPLFGEEESP